MNLEQILNEIDDLKNLIAQFEILEEEEKSFRQDFNLRYTYESNAIEGNTLTLMETKVVLEGVTIGGKSLREHFEVINHHDAIEFIEGLVGEKQPLNEYDIKSIHSLILKGIDDNNARTYRKCNVRISGSEHIPPEHFEVPSKMQDFIQWYQTQDLHPIIKASRTHAILVGIHPFVDGNGRTSRLVMNLELLKAGYPAINIKNESKFEYYNALELAHTKEDFSKFDVLVARYSLSTLQEKKQRLVKI
ncbi:Fic family protein [Helicobacter pametensis]|uniref:Fic family protein n=1 Tax=Helicobacter pametensis TaxID=95149 RepID=UPI0004B60665|nr:Fic family protein [Helicobacter pametensis]